MTKIVILGGGVIGLSTAWHCRRQGFEVTVIDRQPRLRDGCSFGNAGMIVPSHFVPLAAPGMIQLGLKWMWNPESPFYIRPRFSWDLVDWLWRFQKACSRSHVAKAAPLLRDLHLASRESFAQLHAEFSSDEPGGFELNERGLLMLCRTSSMFDEEAETAEHAMKLGVDAEVLQAADIAKLEPDLELDVFGGVYYPRDCHLSPNRLMELLQSKLEAAGCQFRWETTWSGFTREGDRIRSVLTDAGEFQADEVVLCAGVWSAEIAKSLGVSLPMQAGKGYSMTVEEPVQIPKICSILTEARVAVTPMGSSLRFGGTMELVGLDSSISQARLRGIAQSVPKYFPRFQVADFEHCEPWVGLRPCSPDGLPYMGRTKCCPNLMVSTGHAMMGISLAMVSGQLVADWMSGAEPKYVNLELLSPDRFLRNS